MKEKFCGNCGQDIRPGDMTVRCRLCLSNYHSRCWEKTGGCTTWSCAGRPVQQPAVDSVAYKQCPDCGEKIIDFALQCRYCRARIEQEGPLPPAVASHRQEQHSEYHKDPILTALLNLIFPGAGYMYLGKFSKGLLWFFIALGAWFFTRGLGLVVVYGWVIYDSTRLALEQNRNKKSGKKIIQRY